jgi:isopropylmalate/homocitrate/citramalate synthase
MDRIMIFDTTLRDGEQSPGAALNVDEKVEIAHHLEQMGVDIIEAGFPISSPGDFRAVQRISREIRNCIICGLTRANRKDIDAAAEALQGAARPRIHTGLGVSDVHIKYKLRTTHEKALEQGVEAVKYAKRFVGVGRVDPGYYGERPQYPEGNHLRALPQRSGDGHGQLADGHCPRRSPGGVHHQRYR